MVQFNNTYSFGQEYVNNYIRNIEELRKNIENSLLYVVSYFVEHNESENLILPAGSLINNKEYLQDIGKRYFKRDFDFKVSDTKNLLVYNVLANLISHSKKLCQYDYCELTDFMFAKSEYFKDVTIPATIIINTERSIKEYNKALPKSMLKTEPPTINIDPFIKPVSIDGAVQRKFVNATHLYAQTLSNIKRAIDFESLKLYDYLCEICEKDKVQIRSNKLSHIFDELKYLCEQEYTKVLPHIEIYPANDISKLLREEVFIDELASNINRGMDTKKLLSIDLQKFLKHNEGKELSEGLEKGFYPELRALMYNKL